MCEGGCEWEEGGQIVFIWSVIKTPKRFNIQGFMITHLP